MKKFISTLAIVTAFVAVMLAPVTTHAAGTATLSLGGGGSVNVNNNVSVTVSENSGAELVNAVTAKIAYDPAKLQFVSAQAAGSFSEGITPSATGGIVTVTRYVTPGSVGVSGSQNVAIVTFKAIAGSTTTAVTTTAGSQVASNGMNIWDGIVRGINYNLVTPAPAPAPTPAPTPAPKPVTTTPPAAATTAPTPAATTTNEVKGESIEAPKKSETETGKVSATAAALSTAPKKSSNLMVYVGLALVTLIGTGLFIFQKMKPIQKTSAK